MADLAGRYDQMGECSSSSRGSLGETGVCQAQEDVCVLLVNLPLWHCGCLMLASVAYACLVECVSSLRVDPNPTAAFESKQCLCSGFVFHIIMPE